jgi:hypothetical protein
VFWLPRRSNRYPSLSWFFDSKLVAIVRWLLLVVVVVVVVVVVAARCD